MRAFHETDNRFLLKQDINFLSNNKVLCLLDKCLKREIKKKSFTLDVFVAVMGGVLNW